MKVWKKIQLKDQDKMINLIASSFTNYLYKEGPINDIMRKYNISREDKDMLDTYTRNRITGLLLLYYAEAFDRINDIANKYNDGRTSSITPEIEGYIEK